jgi:hypothetical protein
MYGEMNVPIIKLQVDHMRHEMAMALSSYTAQLDQNLQQAIERFCTPENLQRIIEDEADKQLDIAIREAVKHWFIYGEGRAVIKRAVEDKLRNNSTFTPLDF